ncbi:hypothetical protein, partial [Bradyrhizobium sp. LeoA1S1]
NHSGAQIPPRSTVEAFNIRYFGCRLPENRIGSQALRVLRLQGSSGFCNGSRVTELVNNYKLYYDAAFN